MKDQGLIPIQLTVRNIDIGDEEMIDMNVEEVNAIFGEIFENEDEDEDFDTVNMMLMIKDTYQVSGMLTMNLLGYQNKCLVTFA